MGDSSSMNVWKVLLADDDPLFHRIGTSTLNSLIFDGYKADTFCTHDYESTCLFLKENPDTALIVLDVQMDHATTGYEVIKFIRDELKNREVRILIYSGDASIESESQIIEHYAISGFIDKTTSSPKGLQLRAKLALRHYQELREMKAHSQTEASLQDEVLIQTRKLLDLGARLQAEVLKKHLIEKELKELTENLEQQVTERTQAAEDAKLEAINASKAKSEFLSRMSHELRTPLNAILGFSQLLLESSKSPLEEAQKESIEQIYIAGKHLLGLVTEILDLSRIEAGKMQVNLRPVSLYEVVSASVTTIKPNAAARNIHIATAQVPADAVIYADEMRAKQVVLNLLSNAIKYGPDNSEVVVRANVSDQTGLLDLVVQDRGPGVKEKTLEHLFTPFERCEDSELDVDGTGVGLAISKKLMELMAGELTYQQPENDVCEFIASFKTYEMPTR